MIRSGSEMIEEVDSRSASVQKSQAKLMTRDPHGNVFSVGDLAGGLSNHFSAKCAKSLNMGKRNSTQNDLRFH